MDKYTIINTIANERRVEQIVQNIAHVSRLTGDLQDLAQMVYVVLLDYSEEVISDLWENEQMNFFIVAIVKRMRSDRGQWFTLFRRDRLKEKAQEFIREYYGE